MNKPRTLVGTPDPDSIRKSRLTWIAASLRLPAARLRQAVRAARHSGGAS